MKTYRREDEQTWWADETDAEGEVVMGNGVTEAQAIAEVQAKLTIRNGFYRLPPMLQLQLLGATDMTQNTMVRCIRLLIGMAMPPDKWFEIRCPDRGAENRELMEMFMAVASRFRRTCEMCGGRNPGTCRQCNSGQHLLKLSAGTPVNVSVGDTLIVRNAQLIEVRKPVEKVKPNR